MKKPMNISHPATILRPGFRLPASRSSAAPCSSVARIMALSSGVSCLGIDKDTDNLEI